MKIGFFGDSYCVHCDTPKGYTPAYDTYIKKIQTYYDADIVNLGINGSSIYDVILLQVKPFITSNNYPDVCVFVWTSDARIFHRACRNLNLTSCLAPWAVAARRLESNDKTDPIINAAKEYFIHLLDWELLRFQYISALEHFDKHTLFKFPSTTKIIHIWNYEKVYDWQTGIELSIPGYETLGKLAADDRTMESYDLLPDGRDWALNHLDGDRKNSIVFDSIRHTIDNYGALNE